MILTSQTSTIQDLLNKVQLNSVSFLELFISLLLAFLIGGFIFLVYKATFRGTIYSYTFNLSLILMSVITTLIILTISSNIILSLGMVGALSIVRFRSALKDPIDIVYIFWSISAGLAVGATQYLIAIWGTVFIGIIIILLSFFKVKMHALLLIVKYDLDDDFFVQSLIQSKKYKLKSKYIKDNQVELTIEVFKEADSLATQLKAIKSVKEVALLSFEE